MTPPPLRGTSPRCAQGGTFPTLVTNLTGSRLSEVFISFPPYAKRGEVAASYAVGGVIGRIEDRGP